MTLLLAIDTSTDQVGLALTDGVTMSELTWPARLRQTATVLQGVDQLLRLNFRTISEVEAVAVAIGPGSFSSLRVGIGVAKGLVLARDVAIIGCSTLIVTAWPYLSSERVCVAVLGAGRGRVAWAVVEGGQRDPSLLTGAVNGRPEELIAVVRSIDGPAVVCGEVPDEVRSAVVGRGEVWVPGLAGRRPGAVAELGWARWHRGEVDDPATLEPIYLHPLSSG